MKIGVMGLRPRQIADVRGRKFNGHELSFFEEKSYSPEKVASFVRKVDKVLVVTAGIPIPKRTLEGIPHGKCHHLAGSISTVIRYLDTLPRAEKPAAAEPKVERTVVSTGHVKKQTQVVRTMDVPKPVSATQEAPATPASAVPEPAPKRLASDVPSGRQSQYTLPKHDILVNYPNSGGIQDYTILRAAQPGDTIRFARPKGVALAKWRNRVAATRNGYWRQYGILIEAHFYEDYVDLVVMRQDAVPQNTVNVTASRERPKPAFPSRDLGSTKVIKRPAVPQVEPTFEVRAMSSGHYLDFPEKVVAGDVMRFIHNQEPNYETWVDQIHLMRTKLEKMYDLPTAVDFYERYADVKFLEDETGVHAAEPSAAVEPAPETPTQPAYTDAEREFWDKVYVASIMPGCLPENAAWFADEALRERRVRFGQ